MPSNIGDIVILLTVYLTLEFYFVLFLYLEIPIGQLLVRQSPADRTGLADQANKHTMLVSCSREVAFVRHLTKHLLR